MGRGKRKSYGVAGMKLICLDPVPLWLSSITVPGRCRKPCAEEVRPCEKRSHIRCQDTALTSLPPV